MGGEIGLMMGASILSFFEVIDLLLFLIYNILLNPLHKKKKEEKEYDGVPVQVVAEENEIEEENGEENDADQFTYDGQKLDFTDFADFASAISSPASYKASFTVGSWKSGSEYDIDGDRVTTI